MISRKIKTILKALVIAASLVFYGLTSFAHASIRISTPTFPSCNKPQGVIKVSYSEGVHGIPGDSKTYTGADTVYSLTNDTLTQCFCSDDEKGIQTNWWKVSSLSSEEIDYLKNLGWVYIPNGANWGLSEAPYMAKNTTFSCKEDRHKDESDDNDDNNDDELQGMQLGAGIYEPLGDILGLASTGDAPIVWALGISATLFTLAGIYTLTVKKK